MEEEMISMKEERERVERALLCSLFLSEPSVSEVGAVLRPEMFSNPDYGFVYQALTAVCDSGKHPDMVLVELEMRRLDPDHCRKTGGLSGLLDGVENYRLELNAAEYAAEIKRRFMLDCLQKLFKRKELECLSAGADCQAVIAACADEMNRLCEDNRETEAMVSLYELTRNSIRFQKERMQSKEDPRMMRTGIRSLDGITGGLYRQEMMVIGGATSDGKTALSMFIAMNVARKNRHVLHFSYEMTGEQTAERYVSAYTPVEADRLRIGGMRETDIGQMEKFADSIRELPYSFVNDSSMTLETMRAEVLLRSRKGECDLVLVDYLHAIDSRAGKNEPQEMVIRRLVMKLKNIAMEANCAMILVSQLNREVMKREDKLPRMSDLRDSGAIEYVADTVLILSRPDQSRLIKLCVLKNRNGATGIAEVYHNGTFSNYYEQQETLPFEEP